MSADRDDSTQRASESSGMSQPAAGDTERVAAIVAKTLLDAPVLDEVRAEALREAADDLHAGSGPDMFEDSDYVYGDWLRDRADRIGGQP